MAKIALAFSIMPDSPMPTIIEWARAAEDAGFDGVFMTEANNDSLACSLGHRLQHAARDARHGDYQYLPAPSESARQRGRGAA